MLKISDALSLIREGSKYWHNQIDQFGISQGIYQNNLSINSYGAWLSHNSALAQFILDHVQKQSYCFSFLKKFHPDPNQILSIKTDLSKINPSYFPCSLICPIVHPAAADLISSYIFQGSNMGKKMIVNFIKKNELDLPIEYITTPSRSNFTDFLEAINDVDKNIHEENLQYQLDLIWDALIQNYKTHISTFKAIV